jgi:hypothetical protein
MASVGTNILISFRGVSVLGALFTRGVSVLGLSCGVEVQYCHVTDQVRQLAVPCQGYPEVLPKFSQVRQTFSRLYHGDPANLKPAGSFLDRLTVDLSLNSYQ